MKSIYKYLSLILLCFFCLQTTKSQVPIPQLSDTVKVSLLTNSPWDGAVYGLFGHTSIRISDSANDVDVVFNYGLFDFNSPNFMLRFVKGETDYSVGYTSSKRYLFEYQLKDIGVTEQVLNISRSEAQKLFEALIVNSEPENRVYRYNYFYDNCTTRARDMIEKNIDGRIIYKDRSDLNVTYRDLVHECVKSEPWVQFGIDIVIGAGADKKLDEKQIQFLPFYLLTAFTDASIENADGSSRKLIALERNLLTPTSQLKPTTIVYSPLILGIILLIISIIVSYLSYTKKIKGIAKTFDFLLFLVAGLAGSIIFFLMYFSVHPCVNPNWNLVWLNPVQLIFAFLFLIKFFSRSVNYYHFINFVLLIVFLLAWFLIPQSLEIVFIPYILAIALRSGMNVVEHRRSH